MVEITLQQKCRSTVIMNFNYCMACAEFCILLQEFFSLNNLYLEGRTPLMDGNMLVNFVDIFPKIKRTKAVHAGIWV